MNIGNIHGINSVVSMINSRAQAKVNIEQQATRQLTSVLLQKVPQSQEEESSDAREGIPSDWPYSAEEYHAHMEAYHARVARLMEAVEWMQSQPWVGFTLAGFQVANPDTIKPIDENHQIVGGMIDAIETSFKLVQLMEHYEKLMADESFDEGMREVFRNSIDFYAYNASKIIGNSTINLFMFGEPPDRTKEQESIHNQLLSIARELGTLDRARSSSSDFFSAMDSVLERLHSINRTIDPSGRVVRGDTVDPMRGRLSAYDLERFDWMNQGVIQGPIKFDFDSPEGRAHRQRMVESGIDFSLENFNSPEVREFLRQNTWSFDRVSVASTYQEFRPGEPSSGQSEFDWLFQKTSMNSTERIRVDGWWDEVYTIRPLDTWA